MNKIVMKSKLFELMLVLLLTLGLLGIAKPLLATVAPNADSATSLDSTNQPAATSPEEVVQNSMDKVVEGHKSDGPSFAKEGMKTVGMLVVLLVVFWWFSNWLKKSGRLARIAGNSSGIECVSIYSVGQKEKIALIRVKNQEILVGITQHSIQPLHNFGIDTAGNTRNKDAPSATEFSKILDSADSHS